jgi:hypothetical protein
MKIQNVEELIKKYPSLIGGCEVSIPNGWLQIVDQLCGYIQRYNSIISPKKQIKAEQVKSKLGGLRFYIDVPVSIEAPSVRNMIEGAIHFSTWRSKNTCEYCGTEENVGCTKGWMITCCEECYKSQPECQTKEWVKHN